METFNVRFHDDSQNVSVHLHVDEEHAVTVTEQDETFNADFSASEQEIRADVSEDHIVFATTFENVIKVSDYERYDGEYLVVPDFVGTTLEVGQKVSERNIEVVGIPVYKTENIGGGYTVVIGG